MDGASTAAFPSSDGTAIDTSTDLRRDRLGDLPERYLAADHPPAELDRAPPEERDASRTGDREPHSPLTLRLVRRFVDGIRGGESPARPMRSDCLRELLHGEPPRALEPLAFRPHVGHRAEQADGAPEELSAAKCAGHERKTLEPLGDGGEALKLTPGNAEPLARVVADAGEAERPRTIDLEEADSRFAEPPSRFGLDRGDREHVVMARLERAGAG
jgi:hypothetical protein